MNTKKQKYKNKVQYAMGQILDEYAWSVKYGLAYHSKEAVELRKIHEEQKNNKTNEG